MLKLLQLLFLGHIHKWKIIKQLETDVYQWSTSEKPYRKNILIIQQCEGCGKLQEFNIVQGVE